MKINILPLLMWPLLLIQALILVALPVGYDYCNHQRPVWLTEGSLFWSFGMVGLLVIVGVIACISALGKYYDEGSPSIKS